MLFKEECFIQKLYNTVFQKIQTLNFEVQHRALVYVNKPVLPLSLQNRATHCTEKGLFI